MILPQTKSYYQNMPQSLKSDCMDSMLGYTFGIATVVAPRFRVSQ